MSDTNEMLVPGCRLPALARFAVVCVIGLALAGCLQTVDRSTDQAELARVAMGKGDVADRTEAAKHLTDQSLLARVARESGYSGIRKQAVAKLNDQSLLAGIALSDPDGDVRRAAIGRLSDQNLLSRIALETNDVAISKDALEKLTDDAYLAEIVVKTDDVPLRQRAFVLIATQEAFAVVASQSTDGKIRARALENLTDQNLLAKVAIGWREAELDRAALDRLTDIALLRKVATEAEASAVRRAADRRLPGYAERQDATRRTALANSIRNVRVEVTESRVRKGALALISRPGNLRDQGSFLTQMPDKVIRPSDPNARFVTVTFAIDPRPTARFGQCDFFIVHADGKRQYSRHITAGGHTMQGFAGCDEKQMSGEVDRKTNVILRFEVPFKAVKAARLSLAGEPRPLVGYTAK